ncbi:hypothetical protein BDV93DRAFT_562610 [Ceratobasidium sp. AG-I]|nr:hypothetical protein BDV93DRAFT_562610 [Ceratobasidium sp. AG-I]
MPAVTDRQAATELLYNSFVSEAFTEAQHATATSIIADLLPDNPSESESESDSDLDDSPDTVLQGLLPPLSTTLGELTLALHSQRYLVDRVAIAKDKAQLRLTLDVWCHDRPQLFRSYMRVTPHVFVQLFQALKDDPVFHNNSNNSQFPISDQIAVTLYRLGHYGNAASVIKIAHWADWGYGTVDLATRRVFSAMCRPVFYQAAMAWPTEAEQEEARSWVEQATCPEWRNGWCMGDGTLAPLDQRPGFFGNTWYDRKNNYSVNSQITGMLSLRIIDISVGLPGSQHDAAGWKHTRLATQHRALLKPED